MLPLEPISLTSLYSSAHFFESSAGGPPGRNWSAESRLNGRIDPRYGPIGGVGAVGSQTPGIGGSGGVYVAGARKPSPERWAISSWATLSPTATPSDFAWPSGIVASEVVYAGSRMVAACAGRKRTRMRCAAAATAACGDASGTSASTANGS